MILLKSSENQRLALERRGRLGRGGLSPQPIRRCMRISKPFEDPLRKRQDQGRFWWELRSCAYYDAFERPSCCIRRSSSIQLIAWRRMAISPITRPFSCPRADLWLLAVLNSPLMWWYTWRYLPHMKDEALSPVAISWRSCRSRAIRD